MCNMWVSHQAAEPIQQELRTMSLNEVENALGVPFEEESSELPKPEYRFQSIGRNARLRTKLARIDQILANETGWLSRESRSSLDGAVSGFLDSVRVQSRELSRGSAMPSRRPIRGAPSSTKPKSLQEMTPQERREFREKARQAAFLREKLKHNV